MSRASEAIRARDGRWSPIGASEVVEAHKRVKEAAGKSQTVENQMLAAYWFLASIRDSEKLTAIASNAEVAAHVPKRYGGEALGESAYRMNIKGKLRECGLVDFPSGKGGREAATVYTFPAFMRLYGIVDNLGATAQEPAKPGAGLPAQNTHDLCGLTSTKHAQKVSSIELLEDRYMGMEGGYCINPQETPLPIVENPQPQQQQSKPRHGSVRESYCPICKTFTRFKQRVAANGLTYSTCTRCGHNTTLPDD